jgi:hypothetical protein
VFAYVALISTEPGLVAATIPLLVTVAMDGFDECHIACDVTVWFEPSGITAIAVNCDDVPIAGGVPATITLATVGPGAVGDAGDRSDEQPVPDSATANPTIAGVRRIMVLTSV